jgi:hypothetical protein
VESLLCLFLIIILWLLRISKSSFMSPLSNELPTNNKSTYLLDHHGPKVKELLSWLRVAKTATILLIFSVLVNFVLMYGLIRYPCSPSPVRCNPYCTDMNVARMEEPPPPIEILRSIIPTSSLPIVTEVAVWQSKVAVRGTDSKESKDLTVRSTGMYC